MLDTYCICFLMMKCTQGIFHYAVALFGIMWILPCITYYSIAKRGPLGVSMQCSIIMGARLYFCVRIGWERHFLPRSSHFPGPGRDRAPLEEDMTLLSRSASHNLSRMWSFYLGAHRTRSSSWSHGEDGPASAGGKDLDLHSSRINSV